MPPRLTTLVRRAPLTALAGLVGLIAQGYYAGHRTLPHFLDQDASGHYGTEGVPIRIVALGDSTMTGPGLLDTEDLWLRLIMDRLMPEFQFDLHVLARGGAWVRDVRNDQLGQAMQLRPDIAIISGGANDSIRGVSLRSIERDLRHIAGAMALVANTVVLTGVGDLGTIPRLPQPLSTAVKWRSRAADRVHARVAALHPRVVNLDMWQEGSEPFRGAPEMFSKDQFHPSAAGQRVWAEMGFPPIAAACRRIVEERSQ